MPLVDVRSPIRPDICTDHAERCADHARAQGAHRHSIWQPVAVHRCAVVTIPRGAVDEQVSASVRADVTERHRLERLVPPPDDHLRPGCVAPLAAPILTVTALRTLMNSYAA
jgi:hypothetical protein